MSSAGVVLPSPSAAMRLGNVTGSVNALVPALTEPLPSIRVPVQSTSAFRAKVAILSAPVLVVDRNEIRKNPCISKIQVAIVKSDNRATVSAMADPRTPHARDVNLELGGLLLDMAALAGKSQRGWGYKRAAKAVLRLDRQITPLVEA